METINATQARELYKLSDKAFSDTLQKYFDEIKKAAGNGEREIMVIPLNNDTIELTSKVIEELIVKYGFHHSSKNGLSIISW